MKDARGHGSNSRDMMLDINGRGIMPSRPFREGTAHQVSIAEDHGIATDHLMGSSEIAHRMALGYSKGGLTLGQRYAAEMSKRRGR